MEELRTARLVLRQFSIGDAPFILELLNSPDWLAHIGDRNLRSLHDARKYIREKFHAVHEDKGVGAYLIQLAENKKSIGTVGLFKRPTLDHPDLGFALLPDYYRKGYALEASQALMAEIISNYGIETIYGLTTAENASSKALLTRLGFLQTDTVRLPDEDKEFLLFSYSIKAD